MTSTQFASISGTMFATVVAARQALVAARRAVDAAEDACECERACRCAARPSILAARVTEREAGSALVEREAAWLAYCELR